MGRGHSERNFSGGYNHYDEHGRKIGRSEKNFSGGYNHYDANGRKTGHTEKGMFGGYVHYDEKGRITGRSNEGFTGGYNHYDSHGNRTGRSDKNFSGGYNYTNGSGGCYIATCVYGSYDCPQVWTLRRYRDYHLAKTAVGRKLIDAYYFVSPRLVRVYGREIRHVMKKPLDHFVEELNARGYSDRPYHD